jgi:hypothetical protein
MSWISLSANAFCHGVSISYDVDEIRWVKVLLQIRNSCGIRDGFLQQVISFGSIIKRPLAFYAPGPFWSFIGPDAHLIVALVPHSRPPFFFGTWKGFCKHNALMRKPLNVRMGGQYFIQKCGSRVVAPDDEDPPFRLEFKSKGRERLL